MDAAGFPANASDEPVRAGWHNAFDGTYRWDAAWFVRVASVGYDADDGSAEFYPGFPLIVRATDAILPLGPIGAGILVANLSFLGALLVLYALTVLEFDDRASVVPRPKPSR